MVDGKKIAIDARMIEMSGIGTYIQHLLGKGIYDIALGNEKLVRKYDKDIKVIPFQEKIYSVGEQIRFPYRRLKEEKVDLVHFPHYNVPLFYRDPYIVTIHDLIHILFPQYLKNDAARIYASVLMSHAARCSQRILSVSENSKKDIRKYFAVADNKIFVTNNAADPFFQKKDQIDIEGMKKKYHVDKDKKIILYVGNLKPHKNLTILIQAFSKLRNRKDFALFLVGKDFYNNRISDTERQYGIESEIVKTGQVDSEALLDLYNAADIFILPSLYEGFGIPVLEAMACGTPVICSKSSSLPEVAGDAALLFDPYNAEELAADIEKLSKDTELYNSLVRKGLARVKQFNWDATATQTKKVISQVLNAIEK